MVSLPVPRPALTNNCRVTSGMSKTDFNERFNEVMTAHHLFPSSASPLRHRVEVNVERRLNTPSYTKN